jgi:DinB superfamily
MEAAEREQILELLERGRTALLDAIDGLSELEASRIPAPGRWSILGCVEHLAISEDYLFAQVASARVSDAPVLNPDREAKLLARGTDRTRRIESPPEAHPAGAFPTLAAAIGHFLASRQRTLDLVRSNPSDLRSRMTWHPILKQANCHEMLISIGIHTLRHVKQIEEIKAELV